MRLTIKRRIGLNHAPLAWGLVMSNRPAVLKANAAHVAALGFTMVVPSSATKSIILKNKSGDAYYSFLNNSARNS